MPKLSSVSPPPLLHARAAILINAATGQILYAHNPDMELPMASTTKMMTAILFCERVAPNTIVTAGADAAHTGECSMHLKLGEKLSAHDLLRGMLLRSANDAAVAAADAAAGSVPAFVQLMNERAKQMGCLHTHFADPNGLPAPDHYSCARDLAMIGRAAMQVQRIRNVVDLKFARIHRSVDKLDEIMRNHTHFVGVYPGANGIKTGWTIAAGHCLVGSAERNGVHLISVVLHDRPFAQDTMALMNWGFAHFREIEAAPAGMVEGSVHVGLSNTKVVPALLLKSLKVLVPARGEHPVRLTALIQPMSAPVRKGETVGSLQASAGGTVLAEEPLVAGMNAPRITPPAAHGKSFLRSAVKMLLTAALILVCLLYGIRIASIAKSTRRRRNRITTGLRGDDSAGPYLR